MGHWLWPFSAAKTKKNTGCENRNQVSSCDTDQLQACCHTSECESSPLWLLSPLTAGNTFSLHRHTNHSLTHAFSFLYRPTVAAIGHVSSMRYRGDSNLIFIISHNMRLFYAHLICVKGVQAGELTFCQNNWKPTITMQLWFKIYVEILFFLKKTKNKNTYTFELINIF